MPPARRDWQPLARLAEDKARPPLGPAVLVSVKVSLHLPGSTSRRTAQLSAFEPDANEQARTIALEANDDGLFAVTELGLVGAGRTG